MPATFWIGIAATQEGQAPRTYDVALFDRHPSIGIAPLHRVTCPAPWNTIIQARYEVDAGKDLSQTYGNAIAQWLFCEARPGSEDIAFNQLGECLQQAARGLAESQKIRLLVCIDPEILHTIEFLHHTFIQSLSSNTVLPLEGLRGLWSADHRADGNREDQQSPVADQLRVLAVLSNPDDRTQNTSAGWGHLPYLTEEFEALIASLRPLQEHQAIFFEELRQPTSQALEATLQRVNPHVFVFVGHGYHHGRQKGEAGLVCIEQGSGRPWSYDALQRTLGGINTGADLRLVVLFACRSFVAAPDLLPLGIPAVVAMQMYGSYDFPEMCVRPFAEPFFQALADFRPVGRAFQRGIEGIRDPKRQQAALTEARQAYRARGVEEHTLPSAFSRFGEVMPTLWLAGPEDRLFAESEQRQRASYRAALISKVSTCEWPGRQGSVQLEKVFLPLPILGKDSQQPVDLSGTVSRGAAIVLQGAEWSGKTTLAHWLILDSFSQAERIPILVNLRDMDRNKQSLEQWLAESCQSWLGLNSPEQVAQLVLADGRHGKALFVIDDVDSDWVAQDPGALQEKLLGQDRTTEASPLVVTSMEHVRECHSGWTSLLIQPLSVDQQRQLVERYGQALNVEPATKDFVQRFTSADEQPVGVTALAGRSGFLVQMLAHFLRQMILLTDEADLLEKLQQHRWRRPVQSRTMLQPDEPVYKQQILEALGFHLYFCRRGAAHGAGIETLMPKILQHMDLGEGPIYSPDSAKRVLEEHVEIRPFLRGNERHGWSFPSPEWLRFYAASQIAALVNYHDEALVGWIESGKMLRCQSCDSDLGTFEESLVSERLERVLAAVKAVKEEDLPAWRRTDPWDCPAVRELRRELVRALPLHPAILAAMK